jgi:hypothetical protein
MEMFLKICIRKLLTHHHGYPLIPNPEFEKKIGKNLASLQEMQLIHQLNSVNK